MKYIICDESIDSKLGLGKWFPYFAIIYKLVMDIYFVCFSFIGYKYSIDTHKWTIVENIYFEQFYKIIVRISQEFLTMKNFLV